MSGPDVSYEPFERLWTPHRMAYIKGEGKPTGDDDCPFCTIPTREDPDALIVARGEHVYAVLNLFPYNAGHLMIVPFRHIADYTDLDSSSELAEFSEFTQTAMSVIRAVSGAQGFNVGMNQGVVAGAGIAAHLHQHVVPRWGGDTNFMPVVGLTRVLPQLLAETRQLLADRWPTSVLGRAAHSPADDPGQEGQRRQGDDHEDQHGVR